MTKYSLTEELSKAEVSEYIKVRHDMAHFVSNDDGRTTDSVKLIVSFVRYVMGEERQRPGFP